MAAEVVHHVALGAEAFAALLGAVERAIVVVHAHVHLQIVPVVERLVAARHLAIEVCPGLMVCQVSLQVHF